MLHVEGCINPDKVASQSRKRPVAETDCEKINLDVGGCTRTQRYQDICSPATLIDAELLA